MQNICYINLNGNTFAAQFTLAKETNYYPKNVSFCSVVVNLQLSLRQECVQNVAEAYFRVSQKLVFKWFWTESKDNNSLLDIGSRSVKWERALIQISHILSLMIFISIMIAEESQLDPSVHN